MKQILPHYYKFVTENPHTLLCRIVGMHRVKMYHLRRQVRFVIMTSVYHFDVTIVSVSSIFLPISHHSILYMNECLGSSYPHCP